MELCMRRNGLVFALALSVSGCGQCGGDAELGGSPAAAAENMAELVESIEVGLDTELTGMIPANPEFLVGFDVEAVMELAQRLSPQASPDAVQEVFRAALVETEDDSLRGFMERINVAELNDLVVASYDGEPLVLMHAAALTDAPEAGAEPVMFDDDGDVYGVVRGEILAFGDRAALDLLGGDVLDAGSVWPDSEGLLDEDAVVGAYFYDNEGVTELLGRAEIEGADVRRAAFTIGLSGGFSVIADMDDDAWLRSALGQAQTAVGGSLGQVRPMAPPIAQGWLNYLELMERAAWSQVSLSRTGTTTALRIAPPSCGTPVGSLLLAAGFTAAATNAPGADPTATYTAIDQRVAEGCAVIEGPDASLPRARLGMAEGEGVLAMLDLGAVLRQGLPTFFGLLPFAMHPEDVATAFGDTPMGMASWDDANGDITVWFPSGGGGEFTTVLPDGLNGMLPIPPGAGLFNGMVDGVGYVVGTPGADAVAARSADGEGDLALVFDAVPEDAMLAVMIPADMLPSEATDDVSEHFDISKVQTAAVFAGGDAGIGLVLLPTGDAETLATELEAALRSGLEEQAAEAAEAGAPFADMTEQMLEQFEFRAEGGVVVAQFSSEALASANAMQGAMTGTIALGAMAAVAIPAFIEYTSAVKEADGIIDSMDDPSMPPIEEVAPTFEVDLNPAGGKPGDEEPAADDKP